MAGNKRPGRPGVDPNGDPPAKVQVRIPACDYDRLYDVARRQGVSVPQVLRTSLRRTLDDDGGDE